MCFLVDTCSEHLGIKWLRDPEHIHVRWLSLDIEFKLSGTVAVLEEKSSDNIYVYITFPVVG